MKLYLISPPQIELGSFAERFKSVAETGLVSFFQLRLKFPVIANEHSKRGNPEIASPNKLYLSRNDELIITAAQKLIPICAKHNIKFIVNDSAELALKCGADGVHVGIDDGGVVKAREILGAGKIIGASCYNSLELAEKAANEGADYISFGAFYPTKTKVARSKAEIETVLKWKSQSKIPCSAIGGITPENANPIIAAGADYICVVSSVWDEENPADAAKKFFA